MKILTEFVYDNDTEKVILKQEVVDDDKDWNLADQDCVSPTHKDSRALVDIKKCRDLIIKDLLDNKKEHNSITDTTINRAVLIINKRLGDLK